MKKLFFALSIVFILISCNNDPMEEENNPFIWTWENDNNFRLVFTTTNVTSYRPNGVIYWTGTYTYNDTHITVKLDITLSDSEMTDAYGDTFTPWYRFEDEVFILNTSSYTKVI